VTSAEDVVVLDTTVLVYAVGDHHEFREPCRQIFAAIESGIVTATTTPEVIQEFVHVRARRRSREDAVELGEAFADLLSPLTVVDEAMLRAGLRIFGHGERLGSFDSVLAAVASGNDATVLVSADSAFATVPGVRHVIPDAAGAGHITGKAEPDT
jgi:uncharacterized protein